MNNFTKFIGVLFILVNTSLFAKEFSIELEKSNIQWKGAKITGAHTGSIKFQEGNIVLKAVSYTHLTLPTILRV